MRKVQFTKMQGAGNDFIMIDNRQGLFFGELKSQLAARLCPRAVAVGADGMIFLENDPEYAAKWDFYNADGSSAEMCGNGARCFTLFAQSMGICMENFSFRTIAGVIQAEITGQERARVRLTDTPLLRKISKLDFADMSCEVYFLNTGVPHAVIYVADIEKIDICRYGAALRNHEVFAPAGTNVNFISMQSPGIRIRTYERGVEGETLACGTGAVAGAIVAGTICGLSSPVSVITSSGDILDVSYRDTAQGCTDIYLEGKAVIVYTGEALLQI